ncbi:MAG: hypothetical protein AAF821_08215 [Cyanobacteria bacterium P01_D01_bin.156]
MDLLEAQRLEQLDQGLAASQQLVSDIHHLSAQLSTLAFGDPSLGTIELPPILGSQADQAHLKAIAILYLASELEAIQLLTSVETFAGLAISGGIRADLGTAASPLIKFWEKRHQRFTQIERQALFSRLFGTSAGPTFAAPNGRNLNFEPLFIQLATALQTSVSDQKSINQSSRDIPIRIAAQQLSYNVISRSGSIGPFAAQALLRSIQQVLYILKQPDLQRALGSRSIWTALRRAMQLIATDQSSGTVINIDLHVERGRHGMKLLAWLAKVSPHLEDSLAQWVPVDHAVVASAIAWLQITQPSIPATPTNHEPFTIGGR